MASNVSENCLKFAQTNSAEFQLCSNLLYAFHTSYHAPFLFLILINEATCRGVANHGRVAEGTRPSPEGVYSGGS